MLVTQDLATSRLKGLVDTRGIFAEEDSEVIQAITRKARANKQKPRRRRKKRSKIAVVSAVVAHEVSDFTARNYLLDLH